MPKAISHVSVGVADLEPVRSLWIDLFGLELVAAREGPDADLAALWGISATQVAEQWLLRTPGAGAGWLHFVRFNEPSAPVREEAAATDLGPKNLDVLCHDMPQCFSDLEKAGFRFRSSISEYELGDLHAREVQMPGHDETNIVLVEVLSDGWNVRCSPAGYAAITSLVVVVPDAPLEAEFYRSALDLDDVMHHRISGPEIEKVVGLPQGAALDMHLLGSTTEFFGRMELITYEGLSGVDRFVRARPPALGTLHCGFAVDNFDDDVHRLRTAGHEVRQFDNLDTIFSSGAVGVVHSPSGMRIELYQRTD